MATGRVRLRGQQDVPCGYIGGPAARTVEHPPHYYLLDGSGVSFNIGPYIQDPDSTIYYCDGTESEAHKRARLAREAVATLGAEFRRPFEWIANRLTR